MNRVVAMVTSGSEGKPLYHYTATNNFEGCTVFCEQAGCEKGNIVLLWLSGIENLPAILEFCKPAVQQQFFFKLEATFVWLLSFCKIASVAIFGILTEIAIATKLSEDANYNTELMHIGL